MVFPQITLLSSSLLIHAVQENLFPKTPIYQVLSLFKKISMAPITYRMKCKVHHYSRSFVFRLQSCKAFFPSFSGTNLYLRLYCFPVWCALSLCGWIPSSLPRQIWCQLWDPPEPFLWEDNLFILTILILCLCQVIKYIYYMEQVYIYAHTYTSDSVHKIHAH